MLFDGPMIKKLRLELERTQKQLATLLGVSVITVCRWETAGKVPRRESQAKLQKLYDYNEARGCKDVFKNRAIQRYK